MGMTILPDLLIKPHCPWPRTGNSVSCVCANTPDKALQYIPRRIIYLIKHGVKRSGKNELQLFYCSNKLLYMLQQRIQVIYTGHTLIYSFQAEFYRLAFIPGLNFRKILRAENRQPVVRHYGYQAVACMRVE
jgi:hypothetical protein